MHWLINEWTENINMVLSPIHIAIILKLSKVVDEIGRFINRLPEPTAILQIILEQKVSLPEFIDGQKTHYKNGLQGMNAFYLASKYSSNCLQALFDIQNRENLIGFDFTPFLKETNRYPRPTPLHLTYCSISCSRGWTLLYLNLALLHFILLSSGRLLILCKRHKLI